ncbi:MAG: ArsR family transcriptional regulator [Candidatus Hodarchaeales archaeon]|jgi:predicted transcriptional regulator
MKAISEDLSKILSNPIRLRIIHHLTEKPLSIKELVAKFPEKISPSLISRHLSILDESCLIERKSTTSRSYELSPFGESFFRILKPVTYYLRYKEIFIAHSLLNLPDALLRNLDMLDQAKLVESTGIVISELRNFVQSIKRIIRYISSTHMAFPAPNLKKIELIYPERLYDIPQFQEDLNLNKHLSVDDVELRLLPDIDIGIAIADNFEKGIIVLPKNEDYTLDYNVMFMIEDEIGMAYLKKMWTYYWNLGKKPPLKRDLQNFSKENYSKNND